MGLTGLALGAQNIAQEILGSPLLQSAGYAGIFLLTMACSASLFLPVPSFGAIGVAGSMLNPLLVGIAGGCGAATGELTGYATGRTSRVLVGMGNAPPWAIRVQMIVQQHGFWGLFALSAIPNPFFDIAGITAGTLGYPPARYWCAVALGKSVVYTAIALLGDRIMLILQAQ
ncbi:MAG: VTT domain-containing protein [Chloroflexota bacterium]